MFRKTSFLLGAGFLLSDALNLPIGDERIYDKKHMLPVLFAEPAHLQDAAEGLWAKLYVRLAHQVIRHLRSHLY